jgi:patatin-related protein
VRLNPGIGNAVNVSDPVADGELRFAVTMNGGVSLAVYMGGAAHELNELTVKDGPYRRLLNIVEHRSAPVVDVLSGTSAGGINAAALALAQANGNPTDLGALKKLWVQQGQIGSLLRQPFRKSAPSILRGDDYFLPQIHSAFKGLTANYSRSDRSVDLTITTTLIHPVIQRTVDDLGTGIVQTQHAGRFHFEGNPAGGKLAALLRENGLQEPEDAFTEVDQEPEDASAGADANKKHTIESTVRSLALATRASASFPVAFEASFIPVRVGDKDPDRGGDMAQFADWDDKSGQKTLSRFTVDGGVLANTPTKPALDAIRKRVAGERKVRRVLLLVHPHAVREDTVRDTTDERKDPPTLVETLTGVMLAASSVGSRSYVDEIERHNELAYRWRDGRKIALQNFKSRDELSHYLKAPEDETPTKSWDLFHTMRVRRGTFVLADQIRENCRSPFRDLMKIAKDVVGIYEKHSDADKRSPRLPFVPDQPPCAENLSEGTWHWGLDMAVGIATFATELLCELYNAEGTLGSQSSAALQRELDNFYRLAREAWSKSANARVVLEMLGEDEERVARDAKAGVSGADPSPREWLTANLTAYAKRMGTADHAGRIASIIRDHVVRPLWAVIREIQLLKVNPGVVLPKVPLAQNNPLLDARCEQDLLEILTMVEVIGYLVTEQDAGGDDVPSSPIELVQLSAQVEQHFAKDFTSDDKLAGMSLNRFGAFLKRSWRANDWIWGRLDAIKILTLIILTPDVVRGLRDCYTDEDLIDQLCAATFTSSSPRAATNTEVQAVKQFIQTYEALRTLRDDALEVLEGLSDPDGGKPLEALASLVAYGYQISAAGEEVPWLAQSVYDDKDEGATGSKSNAFQSRYESLREAVAAAAQADSDRFAANYRLLHLFVDSRLGQEEVGEQLPSDMMLATATRAAAVTATVISAPTSGLSFAAPLTRVIRGFVGVPYWIVTGLAQRGQLARLAAATALALGTGLIALALLAPLDGFISTLVPTIGVGCLITVFAYSAARSRSVVHAAALLGLLVPLVAFAVHRITSEAKKTPSSSADSQFHFSVQESTFAAVSIVVLIAGTVIIANLNSPKLSPLAAVGEWVSRLTRWGIRRSGARTGFPVREGWMYVRRLALVILAIAIAAWAVVVLLGRAWPAPLDAVRRFIIHDIPYGSVVFFALPMLVIVCHGVVVGWRKADKLRPYVRADDKSTAQHAATLNDPAGLAIAWSAVYGALYVSLAVGIVAAHDMKPTPWEGAAAVSSLILGWMFSVVGINLIFWLRERRLAHRLAAAYASSLEAPPDKITSDDSQAFTVDLLVKIGEESTYLIKNQKRLTRRGCEVAERALAKSRVLQMSGRTSRNQKVENTSA